MAASVVWDQVEGIGYKEDPEKGTVEYTLGALVKDLDPGTTAQLIAQALSFMPAIYSAGPIADTYVHSRDPEAVPPFDCHINVNYRGAMPQPVKIRTGATVAQETSDFDAANRALAWTARTPLHVLWNPRSGGAPGTNASVLASAQGARLPFYASKPTTVYTVRLLFDPTSLSQAFTSRTNSSAWKGYAAGVVLCTEIVGESDDGGFSFLTDFAFAMDPDDKWQQSARWVDPKYQKPPKLTAAQIAAQNGIIFPVMQAQVDFSSLPI